MKRVMIRSINAHCVALDSPLPGDLSPKLLGFNRRGEKNHPVVWEKMEDVFRMLLEEDTGIKFKKRQFVIKENECKVAFQSNPKIKLPNHSVKQGT